MVFLVGSMVIKDESYPEVVQVGQYRQDHDNSVSSTGKWNAWAFERNPFEYVGDPEDDKKVN
jgi:hypothetical protein